MSRRKKAVVIGTVLAAVSIGGVAVALWSASGSGSGRARARTAVTLTVAAADGPQDLYPGFTLGDVFFTVTNPNPYPVTLTSMTPGTVTSSDPTNCPASNVTVAAASGLSIVVPAGGTSGTLSIPDVVSMAAAAPDGCQGVSFTIALTLNGTQT